MTGPLLAAALGAQLKEWADSGYYPPRDAIFCAATHPLDDSELCYRPLNHAGCHSSDGRDPWPTDTPNPKDTPMHTCSHGKTGHCEQCGGVA